MKFVQGEGRCHMLRDIGKVHLFMGEETDSEGGLCLKSALVPSSPGGSAPRRMLYLPVAHSGG